MSEVNPMVAPSYSDAVPKMTQPNQGGHADPNYVDEETFSGADERKARMDMNSTGPFEQRLRGFRVDPIGGSSNPGNGGK